MATLVLIGSDFYKSHLPVVEHRGKERKMAEMRGWTMTSVRPSSSSSRKRRNGKTRGGGARNLRLRVGRLRVECDVVLTQTRRGWWKEPGCVGTRKFSLTRKRGHASCKSLQCTWQDSSRDALQNKSRKIGYNDIALTTTFEKVNQAQRTHLARDNKNR